MRSNGSNVLRGLLGGEVPVFYNGVNHYDLVDGWWLHEQNLGFGLFPVRTEEAVRNRYDLSALKSLAKEVKQIKQQRKLKDNCTS